MYQARLFASRHARGYERFYYLVGPSVLFIIKWLSRLSAGRLDGFVTWAESKAKGFLFDCKMCGNCVLSSTGMACPMNCPKTIRNGPCGGVREDGNCEVDPQMKCVWVAAWEGSAHMKGGQAIQDVQFAVDVSHQGTSAWLRMLKQREQNAADLKQAKSVPPTQ